MQLSKSATSRAAGSSLPRPFSLPFADSSRERERKQRMSKVRWLQIEDGSFVALRQNASDAGRSFLG
jgi:hypothetical protein